MAEATPELKQIVQRFCAQLEQMGIRPEKVMLYGSQAVGKAREGSDIDLIVISRDWEGYSPRERLEMLGVAAARILEPIQAQGFTPDEINRNKISSFWVHVLQEQAIAI